MYLTTLLAVLAASATWLGFGAKMRSYFRYSRDRGAAKTALVRAAYVCSVLQIAAIAWVGPPNVVWLGLGIASYAAANGLFWWALKAHGKTHPAFAFVKVPPNSLTTAGPYRLVRHPIYTAYLLAWCAGAVVVAQPWFLLPVVAMSGFYLSAARQEERAFLSTQWAAAYQEYRRRTGMFVPNLFGWLTRT